MKSFVVPIVVLAACVPAGRGQSPLRRVDRVVSCDVVAAPGDLDGDGDVDGLEWNAGIGLTGRVAVNEGGVRFRSVAASGLPPFPPSTPLESLSVSDFNGDGYGDVLAAGTGTSFDGLYFGNAAHAFAPGPLLPQLAGAGVRHVDADFDGDGDTDVALAAGTPLLWINDGSGTFAPSAGGLLGAAAAGGIQVLARDFEGDGDVDLLFAGLPATRAFLNSGFAFFVPTAPAVLGGDVHPSAALGDFDGDGYADLAALRIVGLGAVVDVRFGAPGGFGVPVSSAVSAQTHPGGMAAVDLDGDGLDELLIRQNAPSPTGLSMRLVPATVSTAGVVTPGAASFDLWSGFRAVDLDLDGDLDVLRDAAELLMNDGAGSLVPLETAGDPAAKEAWNIAYLAACADFDGDGAPDALGAALQAARGDGQGGFQFAPSSGALGALGSGAKLLDAAVVDRDQDGDPDLFASVTGVGAGVVVAVLENVGGALTPVGPTYPQSSNAHAVAVDLDLDGVRDAVIGGGAALFNQSAFHDQWYRDVGAAGLGPPSGLGGVAWDMVRGDFDGDGAADLFCLQAPLPGVPPPVPTSRLVLARAGGPLVVAAPSVNGLFCAAGDLDGDGDADLVVDGTVYWSQTGSFVAGPALPGPLQNKAVLADLDHDGDLDLLETPATAYMNGGGWFAAPESILPRGAPNQGPGTLFPGLSGRSAVVDVDFDGDLDVVAPGPTVVLNVTRHLTHDGPPRLGRPSGVKLYGTPGGAWHLFAAPLAANVPLAPFGTVLLDPFTAVGLASGAFAPATAANPGEATLPFFVPNTPSLAGLTLHWQAVDVGTAAFTNRLTSVVAAF